MGSLFIQSDVDQGNGRQKMAAITVDPAYGYVLIAAISMYLVQNVVIVSACVIPARIKTKIAAPTLYPRDSEIKKLRLTEQQVTDYTTGQRSHQNGVEFYSMFMALFLVVGLFEPMHTAYSGAVVCASRLLYALGYCGYLPGGRNVGAFFHFGELYVIYLGSLHAYRLIQLA